jgi:hypothetical protein
MRQGAANAAARSDPHHQQASRLVQPVASAVYHPSRQGYLGGALSYYMSLERTLLFQSVQLCRCLWAQASVKHVQLSVCKAGRVCRKNPMNQINHGMALMQL